MSKITHQSFHQDRLQYAFNPRLVSKKLENGKFLVSVEGRDDLSVESDSETDAVRELELKVREEALLGQI